MNDYEEKALRYAERHGVIEYKVKRNKMLYYTSCPQEHLSHRVTINLDTMEDKREKLKHYYKAFGVIGNYSINYCV